MRNSCDWNDFWHSWLKVNDALFNLDAGKMWDLRRNLVQISGFMPSFISSD